MNQANFVNWEEAVEWLLSQPDKADLCRSCYFDRPPLLAAERFWASTEWAEVRQLLPTPGRALDVGAGMGIATYALARDGWTTTALEPDPSSLVGAESIRRLSMEAGLSIDVVTEWGEKMPFDDQAFDAVHARQVLHHANDLGGFCKELFRVLKPGGKLIATREHVISNENQRAPFLNQHPLHNLYGGENAYQLSEYTGALLAAGFSIESKIGPFSSPINFAPHTYESLPIEITERFVKLSVMKPASTWLLQGRTGELILNALSRLDRRPGRLWSFVANKPSNAPSAKR